MYKPSDHIIEAVVDALREKPAATIAEIGERIGWSPSTVRKVKTYINHHPEEGYGTITTSVGGSPNYRNEERHKFIEPGDTNLPFNGLSAVMHEVGMKTETVRNELISRAEYRPEMGIFFQIMAQAQESWKTAANGINDLLKRA
jgi:hypothetical protein